MNIDAYITSAAGPGSICVIIYDGDHVHITPEFMLHLLKQ